MDYGDAGHGDTDTGARARRLGNGDMDAETRTRRHWGSGTETLELGHGHTEARQFGHGGHGAAGTDMGVGADMCRCDVRLLCASAVRMSACPRPCVHIRVATFIMSVCPRPCQPPCLCLGLDLALVPGTGVPVRTCLCPE